MEIDVRNFHPIGRYAESYRSGALIEAVTLKQIDLSELIGRYNLMLEYIAEQARQLDQAQVVICSYRALPLGPAGYCSYSMREQHEMASDWLSVNAPAQQNHIHLADSAGGKCVICGLPAPQTQKVTTDEPRAKSA